MDVYNNIAFLTEGSSNSVLMATIPCRQSYVQVLHTSHYLWQCSKKLVP